MYLSRESSSALLSRTAARAARTRRTARRALAPSSLPRRPSRPKQHVSGRPRRRVRRRRSRGVVPPAGTAPRSAASLGIRRPARAVAVSRAPSSSRFAPPRVGRRPARERRRGEVVPHRLGRGLHRHGLRRRRLREGDTLLPGVRERVRRCSKRVGKRLVFVTNNSNKSRREYVQFEKRRHLGREGGGFLRRLRRRRVPQASRDEEEGITVANGTDHAVDELREMQIEVDPGFSTPSTHRGGLGRTHRGRGRRGGDRRSGCRLHLRELGKR